MNYFILVVDFPRNPLVTLKAKQGILANPTTLLID